MSGVLANIYMMDIDKKINDFIIARKGIYRRYSDDFIIIVPELNALREIVACIKNLFHIERDSRVLQLVELQEDKTKIYCKKKDNVYLVNISNFTATENKTRINFLGFSFDGKTVTIRDSTISRYYGKLYRKIRTISKHNGYIKSRRTGKLVRISCKKLYKQYSQKGAFGQDATGNFLTYVVRAKKLFKPDDMIDQSTKKHMAKIRKALNKVKWISK